MSINPQQFGEMLADIKYIRKHVESANARMDKIEAEAKETREKIVVVEKWQGKLTASIATIAALAGAGLAKTSELLGKIFL